MLIKKLKNHINVIDQLPSWQDAIRTAAQPLLEEKCIKPEYVDAMIRNVMDNGAYIIIIPGFAMPHARPECGALKSGLSLLKLKKPVTFPEGEEVKLFIALAAENEDAHLDVLGELSEILTDDDRMEELFESNDRARILELLR